MVFFFVIMFTLWLTSRSPAYPDRSPVRRPPPDGDRDGRRFRTVRRRPDAGACATNDVRNGRHATSADRGHVRGACDGRTSAANGAGGQSAWAGAVAGAVGWAAVRGGSDCRQSDCCRRRTGGDNGCCRRVGWWQFSEPELVAGWICVCGGG